jgi:hypothetical protein
VDSRKFPLGESAAFETALDVLGQLIGYGSNLIADEQAKPHPDQALIRGWRTRLDDWVIRRRELDPRDSAAVGRALDQDAALLRSIVKS